MARLIPAAERIIRARALIQKARDEEVPADSGPYDLTYLAKVKGYLKGARDLVKFIPYTPSATPEIKAEVEDIFKEAERAEKEILRKS